MFMPILGPFVNSSDIIDHRCGYILARCGVVLTNKKLETTVHFDHQLQVERERGRKTTTTTVHKATIGNKCVW